MQLEQLFSQLLQYSGDNPLRSGLEKTPVLAARAFSAFTAGYAEDPKVLLNAEKLATPDGYQGVIEMPDLDFISLCEHTFLPFLGTVSIAYQPAGHILGAGAFDKLVRIFAKRLQLQERMNQQIVMAIHESLEPQWVEVKIEAKHCCMNGRLMKTCVRK